MELLNGITIVDFSQFLSGPSAALRLADMGARVIKVERPGTGDICRQLYVSDVKIENESTIFHAINRNKDSYAADLKNPEHLEKLKVLLKKADVMMHNFRPGVMERLGLDYQTVKKINPGIVYAEVSGYSEKGPWKDLPGQDLLLQASSGIMWLSNDKESAPTPMGVAVVDIMAGTHLCQGILAALFRKGNTGEGGLVQVSMFESALDFQFEVLTCFLNDGRQLPERSAISSGHAYVAAPYGIYETKEGYLALAMTKIPLLGRLLGCTELEHYQDTSEWFSKRDEIKAILAQHLTTKSASEWLGKLEKEDVWCAPVMDYDQLIVQEGYKTLEMELEVTTGYGLKVRTTRCPIRVDGARLLSSKGAPRLGEHNAKVEVEFGLQNASLIK